MQNENSNNHSNKLIRKGAIFVMMEPVLVWSHAHDAQFLGKRPLTATALAPQVQLVLRLLKLLAASAVDSQCFVTHTCHGLTRLDLSAIVCPMGFGRVSSQ